MTKREDMLKAIAKRYRENSKEPEGKQDEVDITDWSMEGEIEDYSRLFEKAVIHCANEILKLAAEDDVTIDPSGADPNGLGLLIRMPLGEYEDWGPRWAVSFTEMIRLEIQMVQGGLDADTIRTWRDGMAKLIAEIDEVLKREEDAA